MHGPSESGCPQPPAGGRLVTERLVAVPGGEAGPYGDVRLARAHEGEQPGELVDRVLAVRVDAADVLVAVLVGKGVPRGYSFAQPAILPEREHLCAVLARNDCRPVRRAVVDDEDVAFRKART